MQLRQSTLTVIRYSKFLRDHFLLLMIHVNILVSRYKQLCIYPYVVIIMLDKKKMRDKSMPSKALLHKTLSSWKKDKSNRVFESTEIRLL